jgi:hypothetical protein
MEGVPGTLFELPFVSFGINRSEAFALARGTADWLIASDADMVWSIDPDFGPDKCVECGHSVERHPTSAPGPGDSPLECECPRIVRADAYTIEMGSSTAFSYRLPLLLRGDLPWRSVGSVHEYTELPDRWLVSEPTDKVRITMPPSPPSPQKFAWQAQLLERDLREDPDNPRTLFYLAQTYRSLGRKGAARLYRRRAGMGGFAEEAFYAAYQAALLDPWPAKALSLMVAWEMRPARPEPLRDLIRELNRHDMHHAAYSLCRTPGASNDALFVDRSVWEWGMKFEQSIAAWWVGKRDEAHRLCEELLETPSLPADVREAVERNRNF